MNETILCMTAHPDDEVIGDIEIMGEKMDKLPKIEERLGSIENRLVLWSMAINSYLKEK